ncbi:MAG: hypothetical protein RLZZ373_1036 [Pseudomonadota bacterium]|jgi:uncharacterized membrane protein
MLDTLIALTCCAAALALRPWRSLGEAGPPWPWLAWWMVLPLFWGSDRLAASAVLQPLSGAPLLVLMAGWPLTVLALLPTALLTGWLAQLDPWETLHRLVWLGLVPATLVMSLGAAVRRLLPHHLFVYILGRGFFATQLACTLAGALALWLGGVPADLDAAELMVGRWLSAWGDAFMTGMLVAIFVAFKPQWLATYSDRLYLPRPPRP